ncbi:hypothetical protein [uncultured Cyclobacterium sp.]|uniref:hypothetical protein n=1 Tax=uncultured Cyclobacterium sp. TaxID=453820 RepID=UPI0030EDBE2B|tara:strand:+ start:18350 stop:18529 length:180 start_codon:yes stop_codon:yes gene_type:complete
MKKSLYTLIISALGVIIFAALKTQSDHYLYGWGILVAALVFIFTLAYWLIVLNRKKQQS